MKRHEPDAPPKAVDNLKEANVAFNHSYVKGHIMEEQLELHDRLKYPMAKVVVNHGRHGPDKPHNQECTPRLTTDFVVRWRKI